MKMTIQEYANTKGVSYENVRSIIDRYKEELQGKIEKISRTRYLTDAAQEFLDKHIKVKTVSVTGDNAEILRLNNIIEIERKEKKELKEELDKIKLEQENKVLRIEKDFYKQVNELEKQIRENQSLIDNSTLMLEQKDKEKETLEKEKDKELNLIATNRQARRKYIKELKKKAKEEKKASKEKAAAGEQEQAGRTPFIKAYNLEVVNPFKLIKKQKAAV